MSDAAKSAEHIEDVLTAIRRLVADAPRDDSTDPLETEATLSEGDDGADTGEASSKLVLTQSLRIIDADDPWAPVQRADDAVADDADVADDANDASSHEPALAGSQEILVLRPENETDPAWAFDDRLSDWGEPGQGAETAVFDIVETETSHSTVVGPLDTTEYAREHDATAHDDLADMEGDTVSETADDITETEIGDMAKADTADMTEVVSGDAGGETSNQADALVAAFPDKDDEANDDTSEVPSQMQYDDAARAANFHADTSETRFERETGDDEWPDTTADRALQVIAAARAGSVSDTRSDSDTATDGADAAPSETSSAPEARAATGLSDNTYSGLGAAMDVLRDANGMPRFGPPDDTRPPDEAASDHVTETSDAGAGPSARTADSVTAPASALGTGERPDGSEPPVDADMLPIYARRALLKSLLAADGKFPPEVLARVARTQTSGGSDTALSAQADPSTKAVQDVMDPLIINGDGLAGFNADALRDLVKEAVRNELQGALGERITRNVRKMVRREIRMAMAADALE